MTTNVLIHGSSRGPWCSSLLALDLGDHLEPLGTRAR
jgi:hypothetical protein